MDTNDGNELLYLNDRITKKIKKNILNIIYYKKHATKFKPALYIRTKINTAFRISVLAIFTKKN